MSSSDIHRVESGTFPATQAAESEPSKFKMLGFAVLIIFGVGGLIVAGVGTGGLLNAGSLTNLGQVNSIILIVIGGGGGIPLLVIGIIGFINTRSGSNSRIGEKTAIQDVKYSILEESEDAKHEHEKIKKADEERRAREEDRVRQQEEWAAEQKRAEELEATRQREEQERKNRAEAEKKAREEEAILKQKEELEAKKAEEEKKAKELEAARLQEEQEKLKKAEAEKKAALEAKKLKKEKKARERENIRLEEARLKEEAKQKLREENPSQAFKNEIKYLSAYEKDSSTLALELSKIIPPKLSLHYAVNIIFENCLSFRILPLLDALLLIDTSFTLSPYDKIRRNIVEDEQHLLTNSMLIAMLKEHGLDTQEEKLAACYDLAYRMNHPYIYCLSSTTIPPDAYTLNFLWVNLNPQDRIHDLAQNIFKDGLDISENAGCILDPDKLRELETTEQSLDKEETENWEKVKKSFIYKISKWADVNPMAQINVWYDSALVTQKAQQKTFEMLREISKSRGVNLRLRDIRQLPSVTGEIEHSLHPGTQVYYRVDLLKALIADYMLSSPEEKAKYCVVSDIDVKPMSSEQIFDKRTLDYLESAGYVFNRVGLSNFENSFFIFSKENKDICTIHNETIIQQAAENITELRSYPIDTSFRSGYILGPQSIYDLYSSFREKMKDKKHKTPRKVVKCPRSQFNFGGHFPQSDYRSETFRFIGDSHIPYTRNGRNHHEYGEAHIDSLKDWKAEPLAPPKDSL